MPVTIPLQPSRCQLLLAAVLHVIVLLVVYFTHLPKLPFTLLIMVVLLSLCIVLLRVSGRLGVSTLDALRYADGHIVCYANGRSVFTGTLLASSVVTPHFILLSLKNYPNKKTRRLFLCRSQFLLEDFRQLTVRLRLS